MRKVIGYFGFGVVLVFLFGGCALNSSSLDQNTEKYTSADIDSYVETDFDITDDCQIFETIVSDECKIRLVCSDPACGQMHKHLEIFDSQKEEWTLLEDVSWEVQNYPTAMVFLSDEVGIIVTDYHGTKEYVYRTEDGGHKWFGFYLGEDSDIYTNGLDVKYDSETGIIKVYSVAHISESESEERVFTSADLGVTWE